MNFQILLCLIGAALTGLVLSATISWLLKEFDSLRRDHQELMSDIKRRSAPAIAMVVLVTEVVLIIASDSFPGNTSLKISVTLLLMILFFCANELLLKESRLQRGMGWFIWLFAIFALPFFVWMDRHFDVQKIISDLIGMELQSKIAIGISIPLLFVLPFVTSRTRVPITN